MTKLLNEDGTASVATALLMSHHAFRRDLNQFRAALANLPSDEARLQALRAEWTQFHGALRGHHESEDTKLFPHVRAEHPAVGDAIARLMAEHGQIDPLLERGDRVFARLRTSTDEARGVVDELRALLDVHLATEEAEVVPYLRAAKEFPPPATDEEAALYAQGFAWSSFGVAPEVLDQVNVMLQPNLRDRLPAARAEFAVRWKRVWGDTAVGASHTSIPDQ